MNAVLPPEERITPETFRHEEGMRRPDEAFSRWLAVEGNRIVAVGQTQNSHVRPRNKFSLGIAVHPSFRRQGIGTELERGLREFAVSHGGTDLTATIREDDAASRAFLGGGDIGKPTGGLRWSETWRRLTGPGFPGGGSGSAGCGC